jgi:glycosyltransferase involved in cell wall biosynthesis
MTNISRLTTAPNITFLGEIPYAVLPRYAQEFAVGLNPRIVNDLTRAMSPMKVPEYLSLGIPVVSTDSPEVRKLKDHVYIAETSEHFIDLVGMALKDTSMERRNARRIVAESFSWKSVSERVSNIVDRIDKARHSTRHS